MSVGVSVIIPTWNGLDLLKRFLPSVLSACTRYAQQSGSSVELILVDDASSDGTYEWLIGSGFAEPSVGHGVLSPSCNGKVALRCLRNENNLGFGFSCNRGFRAASEPLIFLLNNDVEVSPDCIAPLTHTFENDEVFAVHCRIMQFGTEQVCGTGKVGSFKRGFLRVHQSCEPRPAPNGQAAGSSAFYSMFAGGGATMFHRLRLMEIGAFDVLLSPFYWEDVELSYRAWKRGFTVLYEPRSVVSHRVSSTVRKLDQRHVRAIEQRNRLLCHWIHLQDTRFLLAHFAWTFILLLTALFRFRPEFIWALGAALRRLPEIRARRVEERKVARRSDREVLRIFAELAKRDDLWVYD